MSFCPFILSPPIAPTPIPSILYYQEPSESQHKVGTALLLAAFTAIGVFSTDLGFVVSFGGAVLGSSLVFIFPALMWITKCRKEARKGVTFKVRNNDFGCPHPGMLSPQ